ncbi:hypothetical protein M0813_13567 [Anaeramoeba flamelloides]|uniref:Rap-GAP domain-containing protein n=1 Tax=Anaeramoeba flamelloides TaxID=1746091 RepID=A0ABQ8Z858_9EUKA|nr:hypothetical protein M0813_13567 [Anaeramoeba flamelloides]
MKKFPPAIKQTIIQSVLEILLDPDSPRDIVGSNFAIRWVMECTGQSFSLPLENHEIISKGIQLYDQWFNGKLLPPKFQQQKQKYYREMIGHLSLLFDPRKGMNTNLAQVHVKLCLQVIEILTKFGSKDNGNFLDEESWEHLLFIIIGVCDHLLSKDELKIEPILTQELTPHLLKVVFDLWLLSGTQKNEMWQRFENAFIKWRHNLQTIVQWSVTTYGLINRVINLLYGKHEGTEEIMIIVPPTTKAKFKPSRIQLNDEKLIFFWQKTLDLLGDPNQIQNPEIFFQAMSGVRDLVTLLLRIGTRRDYEIKYEREYLPEHPDGNSILNIFGKSIFTAVKLARPGFEEGTECCYSILCTIFMTHQNEPFLDTYVTRFYESLIRAFENEKTAGRSICAILCNTTNIFSTELPGVYILVPFYLDIINKILVLKKYPQNISVRIDLLRKSCYQILISLICLPRYLNKLNIQQIRSNLKSELLKINKFEDYQPLLMQIFLKTFTNENDQRNASLLLWSMGVYLYEIIDILPEYSSLVILTCQNFLCNPQNSQLKWNVSVSLTALELLEIISEKTKDIFNHSEITIPNLISSLSQLIRKYINEPSRFNQEEQELFICSIFSVIGCYIMHHQWIYSHPKALIEIMKSVELSIQAPVIGKTKKKQTKTFQSEKIKDAAMYLFHRLFKEVGNYPSLSGPSTKSTLITESIIKDAFKLDEDHFNKLTNYFMIKRSRILTIFEEPNLAKSTNKGTENIVKRDEKSLILLIREINGKYAWRVKFRSLPLSSKLVPQSQWEKHIWNGEPRAPIYKQEIILSEEQSHEQEIDFGLDNIILDYFSIERELQHNCLTHVMGIQHRLEEVYRFLEDEVSEIDINCKRNKPIKRNFTNNLINKNKYQDQKGNKDSNFKIKQQENYEIKKENYEIKKENYEIKKEKINPNEKKHSKFSLLGSGKRNNNDDDANNYSFNNSRLFLANLGLIKLDGEDYLDIIDSNVNFKKSLGLLDKFPERINHICNIFYVGPGQNRLTSPDQIFLNKEGSKDFQIFLTELGWVVDLEKHQGFKGALDTETTGQYAPYYSDFNMEIIFYVSTMITFNDNNLINKKNLFSKNRVIIVWVDDKRIFDPKLIKSGKNTIFVIIKPHYTGLYSIRIENYLTSSLTYGPLLTNSLLSRHLLAELVRKTVIVNDRHLAISEHSLIEPLRYRMGNIKAINNRFKIHLNTNSFYSKLFSKNGKKSSIHYSCLQKTFDKLEFWSMVYVTLIRINFEPCFQVIFKKADGPSEENESETSLKIDLGTITTETETDNLEDECYEDKFQFEVNAIKKLVTQVDQNEFSQIFLQHLEKVIKIYTELVEKKNAKIEKFDNKLKIERKKYKSKYDGLQSHLQRRMDGLENNKNDKTKLMKKSLGLKSRVNKYTQLMRKHQIYIDKLNKLVEDSDEDSGSDSNSDYN